MSASCTSLNLGVSCGHRFNHGLCDANLTVISVAEYGACIRISGRGPALHTSVLLLLDKVHFEIHVESCFMDKSQLQYKEEF